MKTEAGLVVERLYNPETTARPSSTSAWPRWSRPARRSEPSTAFAASWARAEMSDEAVLPRLNAALPVRSQPLSEQVAEAIRQMILVGQLPPGEVVTQDRLAEMLAVSTMPVREALLRLSHEGFVEARRNRSFQVARTSREDIDDVYQTHAYLAGELTARAATRGGPELATRLRAVQQQWPDADLPALERLNWQFHREINRAAGSPRLMLFLRNTIRFVPNEFYALLPEWRAIAEPVHREIIRAVGRQDAERARRAAERHVKDARRLLTAYFTDKGYWSV
jgi:DNA-binding GntR family transcriptional regulator